MQAKSPALVSITATCARLVSWEGPSEDAKQCLGEYEKIFSHGYFSYLSQSASSTTWSRTKSL